MAGTQTVTLLFTDLVGSTALSSSLPPGDAESLRQEHLALLRRAISDASGIEVKNMGDGLMVAFSSATRAIDCAVQMQQLLERRNRVHSPRLQARIGVAMGEAVEENGDYFGDPVVQAARLCSSAEGGQILTTALVRSAVGRQLVHDAVCVGHQELKGLPDPVEVWDIRWRPAVDAGGGIPLPPRLAVVPGLGFVGREGERLALAQTLAQVVDGAKRVALVGGEAGIGKTTLCAEVARGAHEEGWYVLYGRAEEDIGLPYQPWVNVLAHLVAHADDALLDRVAERDLAEICRLVPELVDRRSGLSPAQTSDVDTERQRLLHAVLAVLSSVSNADPLLIVLDDLHWGDAASLLLLRHVIVSDMLRRVLILGNYRADEVVANHPLAALVADLRREPGVEHLVLEGLEESDVVQLMQTAAGHDLDASARQLAREVRRETAGNPFFTGEILRHLAESGAVTRRDGRWVAVQHPEDTDLPESVRAVVGRRVARLGQDVEQVLRVAAVLGETFDLGLLAAVLDEQEDAVLNVLERAVSAALVVNVAGEEFRFAHALVRHGMLAKLAPARRARLHRRTAEALEQREDAAARVVELAHHWAAASGHRGEQEKALLYARRAGDAARVALAPQDAIEWYNQALARLPVGSPSSDRVRVELLIALGESQRLAAEPTERETLLEAAALARKLGDRELIIAAVLASPIGIENYSASDPQWLAALEAGLEAAGEEPTAARAHLLAALAEEFDPRDWERRRAIADQAIAIARQVGDPAALVAVLNRTHVALSQPEALERRLAETAEAVAIAEELGDPVARFSALNEHLVAVFESGDRTAAERDIAGLDAIADEWPLPYYQWVARSEHCNLRLLAGEVAAAEAAAAEQLEIGTRGGRIRVWAARAVYVTQMVRIREEQGRVDEIIDDYARAYAENSHIAVMRADLARIYCSLGRLDEARSLFDGDAAARFQTYPRDLTWLTAMARCADTSVELDDRDTASYLYDRLIPFADRMPYFHLPSEGAIARPLGRLAALLGRHDQAEMLFERALRIHERWQTPYWTARTQLDLVESLRDRRLPPDLGLATTLTNEAAAIAGRHGYGGLERRAGDLKSLLDARGDRA